MYKSYNTRSSGGYNTPGQFVSSGELVPGAPPPSSQQYRLQKEQASAPPPPPPAQQPMKLEEGDAAMDEGGDGDASRERPAWMKTKMGIKISNRERRRRQNNNLRRLLTPKNALMVLNEVLPPDHLNNNNFTVEAGQPFGAPGAAYGAPRIAPNFVATLDLDGRQYKGYGDSKMSARNAAAEQAFREIIIGRMNTLTDDGAEGAEGGEGGAGAGLPMIQLASFALHKLFAEWEAAGARVPPLRPPPPPSESESASGEPPAKKSAGTKSLPANAASMHPGVLLAYMRPGAEYRALAAAGDRPHHMTFTVGVDVDGATYIGKAQSKKEARKRAARAACLALFNVTFDDPHDN